MKIKKCLIENCEEINNAFARLSHIQNEISDVDFSIDYDDDMAEHSDNFYLCQKGYKHQGV